MDKDVLLIRVPEYNNMKLEIERIYSTFGGVFAMNVTRFIETHECVPMFESPAVHCEDDTYPYSNPE